MSDHDVFSEQSAPPATSVEDLLASIKNESGEQKYQTVPEAMKALANSQAFIPQLLSEKKALEEETQRLREQAVKSSAIDEVLDKLRAAPQQKSEEEVTPPVQGLSEEQVSILVRRALEEQQQSAKVVDNVTRVNSELVSRFGKEKATEVLVNKCRELNTTPEKLKALAADNPDLVLSLFGDTRGKTPQPVTSSQINRIINPTTEVAPPQKSILTGATSREQKDYYKLVEAEVYAKLGVSV